MPPAISDEEMSDGSVERSSSSAAKKPKRQRTSVKYQEPDDEYVKDEEDEVVKTVEDADTNGDNGDDDEEDEDGEEGDDDVFVVEKIVAHMIQKNKLLFHVKWEGYDSESDMTWEPEDNLRESASDVLDEYLESIGGRDKVFEDVDKALKTKKRGRPSSSTPNAAPAKRSRKNGVHPADSTPPASAKVAEWKVPSGSWEDAVESIDACQDEEKGDLIIYLTWKNGQKTQHPKEVIYRRCPQKMLRFYERNIRIARDGEVVPLNHSTQ